MHFCALQTKHAKEDVLIVFTHARRKGGKDFAKG